MSGWAVCRGRVARGPGCRAGSPLTDPQLGIPVPFGIYDLAANTGCVNVGTDQDAAAFAVESIRRWWLGQGQAAYPRATRRLITADASKSNATAPGETIVYTHQNIYLFGFGPRASK